MLASLIKLKAKDKRATPDPADYLNDGWGHTSLGDSQNSFGSKDEWVFYTSRKFGKEIKVEPPGFNGSAEYHQFAHLVWPSGILMAELVGGRPDHHPWRDSQSNEDSSGQAPQWWLTRQEQELWNVKGKSVLELGAGAGLGGISSALAGAALTVISDFPAEGRIDTLRKNVLENTAGPTFSPTTVLGHRWGDVSSDFAKDNSHAFQHILVADCLWTWRLHSELAESMSYFLSNEPMARVHIIAGYHSRRLAVSLFLDDALPKTDLEVESCWECDFSGNRREWSSGATEESSDGWLFVATLKRRHIAGNGIAS